MEIPEKLLQSIRDDNRISHKRLDGQIIEEIQTCIEELTDLNILADLSSPRVWSAVKMHCRSKLERDAVIAEKCQQRYEAMKASLQFSKSHLEEGSCHE